MLDGPTWQPIPRRFSTVLKADRHMDRIRQEGGLSRYSKPRDQQLIEVDVPVM